MSVFTFLTIDSIHKFFVIQVRETYKVLSQAWKFGGNDRFVTASFLSLIKDSNNNLFPQIHLHNANTFFEDLIGKYFYNLAYKLHFLHTIFQCCTNKHVFLQEFHHYQFIQNALLRNVLQKINNITVKFVVFSQQPSSQDLCVNIAHIGSKTFCCTRKYIKFVKVSFQVLIK